MLANRDVGSFMGSTRETEPIACTAPIPIASGRAAAAQKASSPYIHTTTKPSMRRTPCSGDSLYNINRVRATSCARCVWIAYGAAASSAGSSTGSSSPDSTLARKSRAGLSG